MRALFCHDHFYKRTQNGQDIVSEGQFHAALWQRYLGHFDALTVLGRDGGCVVRQDDMNTASDAAVTFVLFPDLNNVQGLLSGRHAMKRRIRMLVQDHDCIILRGISEIGLLAYAEAKRQNKVIVLEMIACSWDSLWYYGSLSARLYAPYRYYMARKMAKNADAILYVSRDFLPRRYPSNAPIRAVISNVETQSIQADILSHRQARISAYHGDTVYKIGLIGAVSNALKGVNTAIEACARIKQSGFDRFELHILGPGDPRDYDALVQKYGLENHVFFDGIRQSGGPVHEWLADMDIYIQPSLQEGLPRAVIEAMSLALPVIGSNAGGIPELLDTDYMVGKKQSGALADKILRLVHNHADMAAQAERNFNKAKAYGADVLTPQREAFWHKVTEKVRVLRCQPK